MEGLGVDSKHVLSRGVTLRLFQSYLPVLDSGLWEGRLRSSAQKTAAEPLPHCSKTRFTQRERTGGRRRSLRFPLFPPPHRASPFFLSGFTAQEPNAIELIRLDNLYFVSFF